jgi:hypothetical protein
LLFDGMLDDLIQIVALERDLYNLYHSNWVLWPSAVHNIHEEAGKISLVVGDEKEGGSVAEKGTWGELEGELLTPSPLGHGCTERGAFRLNQQCLWQPLLLASAVTQSFLHCWVHKVLV